MAGTTLKLEKSTSGTLSDSMVLSGKYLLTHIGQRYCTSRRIPLRDLRLHSGVSGTGFAWNNFRPVFTQQLVSHSLLSDVDLERLEFMSKRSELIKATTHISRGFLQWRFKLEMKNFVENTSVIKSLYSSPAAKRISTDKIAAFLKSRKQEILLLQQHLFSTVSALMDKKKPCADKLRTERKQSLGVFLASLSGESWFFLTLIFRSRSSDFFMSMLADYLLLSIERLEISDYISLLLVEFVQHAERAHLVNLGERDQYVRTHPEELNRLLADPRFRERLIQRAERKSELVNVHYGFSAPEQTGNELFSISVRNKGLIGYKSRAEVVNKRSKQLVNTPLKQFLKESQFGAGTDSMAALYVTSLENACSSANICFDSHVCRDERKDETVSRISLHM